MNILQNIEGFSRSLVLIGAEIVFIILLFILLATILRFIFDRIGSIPALQKYLSQFEKVKNRIRGMLTFLCILTCTAVLGYNGFLLYKQIDVYQQTLSLFEKIPADFWSQLLIRLTKTIGIIVAAHYAIKLLFKGLLKVEGIAKSYEHLKSNEKSINTFFKKLSRLLPEFCTNIAATGHTH